MKSSKMDVGATDGVALGEGVGGTEGVRGARITWSSFLRPKTRARVKTMARARSTQSFAVCQLSPFSFRSESWASRLKTCALSSPGDAPIVLSSIPLLSFIVT
jgi:hypothetical protein